MNPGYSPHDNTIGIQKERTFDYSAYEAVLDWTYLDHKTANRNKGMCAFGKQARGQTMSTVGAPASNTCAHTFIYVYNALLYIYCVFTSVINAFVRTTKFTLSFHSALCNTAQNTLHIHTYIFEKEPFPITEVQKWQHVDVVGCRTVFFFFAG